MVDARDYIAKIREEIKASSQTRLGRDSVNMLNTVAESVFSRSAHFILELLQNAEDAGPKNCPANGEIEFVLSQSRIRITHNGTPFAEANVDAICGVRSTKKPELGTLGFLGIGFKSVFKITDCPEVHSGEFHFKFDKSAHDDPTTVPWQIMPIWDDVSAEPPNPDLTTFILPFRSTEFYEQTRDELKKLDVHVFLFLKWLRRLRIVDESNGESVVVENLGETDGFISIKKNDAVQRFIIRRRSAPVPEEVTSDPVLVFYKRQNVTQREVVIAFAVNKDGDLESVDDASALGSVSSFLPLVEERSGAKFLIQADFLVQPGREAIQYELAWNRWLVREAVENAKDAIEKTFKPHPRWRRQFLPLFSFRSYGGQPAYEKLFSPHLRTPLLEYLRTGNVVATETGTHVRPDLVVNIETGLRGLLTDTDLPVLLPGGSDLRLVDPAIEVQSLPLEIQQAVKQVDLGQVSRSKKMLQRKIGQPEWFQKLYLAMAESDKDFRRTQTWGRRGRIEWVDNPIYVLTESDEILPARGVHLRGIPKDVLDLRASHPEVDVLLRTYQLLNACLNTDELNKFFKERTHVEAIDYETICRTAFLPKMRTDVPAPSKPELLAYTRLLQKGPPVNESIWVLTKTGDVKPSNQVFMGSRYSPVENWGKNARYSAQIAFLSAEYLDVVPSNEVAGWKGFFSSVGVKESGENNDVEMFAMAFVQEKLDGELSDFLPKNRKQFGYDLEARRQQDGALVRLEIKGRKKDLPVELVGNEPQAARNALNNREPFWVCIVPGIPEDPQLWIVEDALQAGTFDTLKIDVAQWRTHGRRVP